MSFDSKSVSGKTPNALIELKEKLQDILDHLSGSETQVDVVAALPAGDNNIGNVDIVTLPSREVRWGSYDTISTALSSDLNSLADAGLAISSAIDFTAAGVDRKKLMDIEIYLASVDLSGQTNPAIYIWLLARTDGTNFEDGSGSVTPARTPDAIIPLRVANAVQRVFAKNLETSPDQAKILVKNNTGATLAASGNTVKYYTYGEERI